MHVFISAGEPSGDLHAANLIRHIRARHPDAVISGLGGENMQAAGANVLYPLTQLAVMWVGRVLVRLPTFFRIADMAERYFLRQKPDCVILIDYPGFHWHLAKRAKAAGIPVYYFVPPQLWAWAGWRVRKMRRTVNCVLTALPFEDGWYRRRGVNTQYIGHPYFDELANQPVDADFVSARRADGRPIVAILPGSRTQEVTGNIVLMKAAAEKIFAARPDAKFLVAAFNEKQAAVVREAFAGSALPVEIHVKRTTEIIELATATIAVSGSVGLELLYRTVPAVVVYRLSGLGVRVGRFFMKCKYISLVNLLAGEELYPEFLTAKDDSGPIADHILKWLNDPAALAEVRAKLAAVRAGVAVPGACARAAEYVCETVAGRGVAFRRAA